MLKSAEELAAYYLDIPDPERRAQRKSVVENGIAAPIVAQAFLTLDGMLADMEEALAGNDHLVEGGYGLADAALTPFVSRLDELAMDWMWARRPNLAGWWDAVRERPSFGAVFDAFPDAKRKAGLRDAGLESVKPQRKSSLPDPLGCCSICRNMLESAFKEFCFTV